MSRQDVLFLKILEDEQFASAFDIDVSRYRSLEEGKKDLRNANVRAVAEIVDQMSKKINKAKDEMKIRNKTGPVVLTGDDFRPIYNTVLSLLNKQK